MGLSPFVKCICPSCFEEIYLGECRIVSGKTSGVVLKEPKGPFARMYVEPLDGRKYTLEMARRECTKCGYHLPYNIELVPSITLVIVGDTFSGKSHYIAGLIQQFKEEWAANAQGLVRMTCLTPEAEHKYITEYYEPLFIEKRVLPSTQPAISERAEPLIYKLVVSESRKHPATTHNLVIYDTAGEDFLGERLIQFARFVLNTSALIFVADPFAMAPFTNDLPPSLQASLQRMINITQKRRVAERFNEIIDIFERYHGHSDGSSLPSTPVAVMFSKSDMLKSMNPPRTLRFLKNPPYGGGLDLQDIEEVDREVRDLLLQYKQGDILAATARFKHVKFFATSATGEPPDGNGNFSRVEPCRCLDPLLWILYRLGIIPSNF